MKRHAQSIRTLCLILLIFGGRQGGSARAEPGPASDATKDDPQAWSVRSYRLMSRELWSGHDNLRQGYVKQAHGPDDPFGASLGLYPDFPELPGMDSQEAEVVEFLRQSSKVASDCLCGRAIQLPEGSLLAYDNKSMVLAVRTTGATHALVKSLEDDSYLNLPNSLSFRLELVEVEAAVMRAAVQEAAAQSGHAAILAKLEAWIAQKRGRHLETIKAETKSEQVLEMTSGDAGTKLEVDPYVSLDGQVVGYEYRFAHQFTAALPGSGIDPMASKIRAHGKTVHAANTTQLLSVWAPENIPGAEPPRLLQAAFLRCNVVPLLPAADDRVLTFLNLFGDKALPTPPAHPAPVSPPEPVSEDDAPLVLKRFRVPDVFTETLPLDPFSIPKKAWERGTSTPRQTLEALGVSFPEGASVEYCSSGSKDLLIRNTPSNLQFFDFVSKPMVCASPTLGFTLQIIQADANFLRQLEADSAHLADHTAAWQAVEKAAGTGHVTFLRTLWIQTGSGQSAEIFVGAEAGPDPKQERVGLVWKLGPIYLEDAFAVDLTTTLAFDYAQPSLSPQMNRINHRTQLKTQMILLRGKPRLAAIWQPGPNAQVLQTAFIEGEAYWAR